VPDRRGGGRGRARGAGGVRDPAGEGDPPAHGVPLMPRKCGCQRAQCAHQKGGPVCDRAVPGKGAVLLCEVCFSDLWQEMYGKPRASEGE